MSRYLGLVSHVGNPCVTFRRQPQHTTRSTITTVRNMISYVFFKSLVMVDRVDRVDRQCLVRYFLSLLS